MVNRAAGHVSGTPIKSNPWRVASRLTAASYLLPKHFCDVPAGSGDAGGGQPAHCARPLIESSEPDGFPSCSVELDLCFVGFLTVAIQIATADCSALGTHLVKESQPVAVMESLQASSQQTTEVTLPGGGLRSLAEDCTEQEAGEEQPKA